MTAAGAPPLGALASSIHQYVLFGGSEHAGREREQPIAAFDDESEARAAFVALRLGTRGSSGWGKLVAVSTEDDGRLLCWFGEDYPGPPVRQPVPPGPSGGNRRRYFLRRWQAAR